MRIAVPYENGGVYQHFGHTESFKLYDVEDGQVKASEIIASEAAGHSALSALLAEKRVDVLVCGGIGESAQAALEACGITICPGAEGDADAAVAAYLNGEIVPGSANCDHHEEGCGGCEGHSCHDESHGCGGCGGGCGGCGGHRGYTLTGKNVGKTVKVHYKGTLNDGSQFDSSYDRGEPLEFVCGAGMMIRGFDAAVAEMEIGETVQVHLMPEEAYGERDPRAVFSVDVNQMPGAENLSVGQRVFLYNQYSQPVPVTVAAREGDMITFDANHQMAGQELNFQIELISMT